MKSAFKLIFELMFLVFLPVTMLRILAIVFFASWSSINGFKDAYLIVLGIVAWDASSRVLGFIYGETEKGEEEENIK